VYHLIELQYNLKNFSNYALIFFQIFLQYHELLLLQKNIIALILIISLHMLNHLDKEQKKFTKQFVYFLMPFNNLLN